MTSRRRFLKSVVGGAAALTRTSETTTWDAVRAQFSFGEDRVPLNAGNLCPAVRRVADRLAELTADIDADVSYTNRAKFRTLLETSRTRVAEHIRAEPDEVALVRNTSEANSTVITGLDLTAGDEVILWSENHPTNNVAWDVQAERLGFAVRRVQTPRAPTSQDELAAPFIDALSARTRVVAVSHLSNLSGTLLPVDRIARAVHTHRRDAFVLVDGAQTWGALDVDVHALDCDAFTASAHKWLCGPKEAGLLYVRRSRIDDVRPHTVAFGWSAEHASGELGARKYETLGQRDDPCLAAVAPAVEFHLGIGTARVEARVRELATRLKEGLRSAGVPMLTPEAPALSGGVCTVAVAPERRRELVFALDGHGVAGSPAGGLRLCPHVYNTDEHVDRTVRAVAILLA